MTVNPSSKSNAELRVPDWQADIRAQIDDWPVAMPGFLCEIFKKAGPERWHDLFLIRDLMDLHSDPADVLLILLCSLVLLARDEGHICLRLEQNFCENLLQRELTRLQTDVNTTSEDLGPSLSLESTELIQQLLQKDLLVDYAGLISSSVSFQVEQALVLVNARDGTFVYLQKFYIDQKLLSGRLQTFIEFNSRAATSTASSLKTVIKDILIKRPMRIESKILVYAPEQLLALALGGCRSCLVVSGGPGTGKTSVVAGILRLWCHPDFKSATSDLLNYDIHPDRIFLVAPTGRAARRLAESVQANLQSIASATAQEKELMQLPGQTLHSLLGYNPIKGTYRHGPERPVLADAIVLDESSMVDLALMSHLLLSIDPERTRLVLVGDRFQLPSVGAGAVLTRTIDGFLGQSGKPHYESDILHLVDSIYKKDRSTQLDLFNEVETISVRESSEAQVVVGGDAIVLLNQSHRSTGQILAVARSINNGQVPDSTVLRQTLPDFLAEKEKKMFRPGVQIIHPATVIGNFAYRAGQRLVEVVIQNWLDDTYRQKLDRIEIKSESGGMDPDFLNDPASVGPDLFKTMRSMQILALLHRGPCGTRFLNQAALRAYVKMQGQVGGLDGSGMHGVPLLIQQNDPVLGLANGDVGILLTKVKGGSVILFENGSGFRVVPLRQVRHYDLAFAITVHKSQGSEYDGVLLILPDNPDHPLLTREILYTGLTRAKQTVWIYGDDSILAAGAARPLQREMGPLENGAW